MIPMSNMFKHRNATLRSNILEHYGINAVLETLPHETVDIDFIDGREYKLLNVVIPDNSLADRVDEQCLYLQMVNPSTGEATLSSVLVEVDDRTGLAKSIQQIIIGGSLKEIM